jgi:hypothetical protein
MVEQWAVPGSNQRPPARKTQADERQGATVRDKPHGSALKPRNRATACDWMRPIRATKMRPHFRAGRLSRTPLRLPANTGPSSTIRPPRHLALDAETATSASGRFSMKSLPSSEATGPSCTKRVNVRSRTAAPPPTCAVGRLRCRAHLPKTYSRAAHRPHQRRLCMAAYARTHARERIRPR